MYLYSLCVCVCMSVCKNSKHKKKLQHKGIMGRRVKSSKGREQGVNYRQECEGSKLYNYILTRIR